MDTQGGQNLESRETDTDAAEHSLFLGRSDASRRVRRLIHRAAEVDLPVLITGESGVGKEIVAREIHRHSERRQHPFVPLNCSAIPETLVEAELFGHEAGAYTDARHKRRGAFEMARHGTLFLDEIGELSAAAQPKLLRALESGEITRLGAERTRAVNLHVIAATNNDLKKMCKSSRFRRDLYYRLCVFEIHVPPLRHRVEDITELSHKFAQRLACKIGRGPVRLSDEALRMLEAYHWPGNVRQLKNLVERAMALNSGPVLGPMSFDLEPISLSGSLSGLLDRDWKSARKGFENAYAQRQLERHGSAQKAARAAGLATGSFYKMLRRLGLRPGTWSESE